jgi:hypothetical protein
MLKFSEEKYSLVLHLVDMDTVPGPSKLCRSDRIRIHNTECGFTVPFYLFLYFSCCITVVLLLTGGCSITCN